MNESVQKSQCSGIQKTKLTQTGVIKVSFDESDVCVEHHKIKCEMIKCTEKSLVMVMSAV